MFPRSFHQNDFEGKLGCWQNYLSQSVSFPQGASTDREGKHLRQNNQETFSHKEKLCCHISPGSPRAAFSLYFLISGQIGLGCISYQAAAARGVVQHTLGELFWPCTPSGHSKQMVRRRMWNKDAKPLCNSCFLFSPCKKLDFQQETHTNFSPALAIAIPGCSELLTSSLS